MPLTITRINVSHANAIESLLADSRHEELLAWNEHFGSVVATNSVSSLVDALQKGESIGWAALAGGKALGLAIATKQQTPERQHVYAFAVVARPTVRRLEVVSELIDAALQHLAGLGSYFRLEALVPELDLVLHGALVSKAFQIEAVRRNSVTSETGELANECILAFLPSRH